MENIPNEIKILVVAFKNDCQAYICVKCNWEHKISKCEIMYSRIHEKLLILYFENARGAAPSVLKEKNQQSRVYSTT